jgi:hypothetical protein
MPEFRFKIIKKCQDCLTRQLSESVRIDCRTEVLNSKSVYSRNRLPRLILETPEWEKKTEDNRRSQNKTREKEGNNRGRNGGDIRPVLWRQPEEKA